MTEEEQKAATLVAQGQKEQNHVVHGNASQILRQSSNDFDSASQKAIPRSAPLLDHLQDATIEAKRSFAVLDACIYANESLADTEHAMKCDCDEEWDLCCLDSASKRNTACGEDSDCINRATKIECVVNCGCGSGCQNQRFQQRQYANVSVIKTEKKGYGLRNNANLRSGDFIFEYIGEVINESLLRQRMVQYNEEGIKHFYFMSLSKHTFVDATKKGNLGRFCNHSCSPNCCVDKWTVGKKLRMGIFAMRNIRAGEELVFNYNVDRYGASPQPCHCEEPSCTGFISGKIQTERTTKVSNSNVSTYIPDHPEPATDLKTYCTDPIHPPPAYPKTKETIEERIAELEKVEKENAYRYELLCSKRKREDDETMQRRREEDDTFVRSDRAIDAEEFSLRHKLKRLRKDRLPEEADEMGRTYTWASMLPPVPSKYQSPVSSAKRHNYDPSGQISLQQPHMLLQNATNISYNIAPPPLPSSSLAAINPLIYSFAPIKPKPGPGSVLHNLPKTSSQHTISEAFMNRHHRCERFDAFGRGIWTSYGPGGTVHKSTGPKVEMYLRCSDCPRIDWKIFHGFQCHLTNAHSKPKGTVRDLENALNTYGVRVSEIEEYDRLRGPIANPQNKKPKSRATLKSNDGAIHTYKSPTNSAERNLDSHKNDVKD